MVVVGLTQVLGVLQDLPHPRHKLVEELASLGIVEQAAPHTGDLNKARQGKRREGGRQAAVEVEEQLEGAVLQESWPPSGGNLDSAEIVRGLVSGGADEVEGEAVVGQPQQLGHQAVLGGVGEVQVALVLQGGAQEGGGQLEDLEKLAVSEARGDFSVFCKTSACICLTYLPQEPSYTNSRRSC